MTANLGAKAEIVKLGRLLGIETDALGFLEGVEAEQLSEFRQACTDALYYADGELLTRLADASKLLPSGLIAAISRRAFGPLLAARITGFMDPQKAADVGKHLEPAFLADITVQLDPRRSTEIIGRMDTVTILDVTEELLDRADYVTLGCFVGCLPAAAVEPVLDLIDDDELIRICAVAESAAGVDEIFDLLTKERLVAVRRAATRKDMRQEAVALKGRL